MFLIFKQLILFLYRTHVNLAKQKDWFATFQKGFLKCRDYIFNFLYNPAIPADNNASEKVIRKLKIKLKNSGYFRSDLGADAFLELHSIVETTKELTVPSHTCILLNASDLLDTLNSYAFLC